jgi:hypothetical protein
MWHAYPASAKTRGWAVGIVAASDIALLGYDALLLSQGRCSGFFLAVAESFVGVLQLSYGIVTSLRAARSGRALA